MEVGDKVRVKGNCYECEVRMIDEGEYYVCYIGGCMWVDESDIAPAAKLSLEVAR